jgi:hypothetical protein
MEMMMKADPDLRLQEALAEAERLREALRDAAATLIGAASAYRKFARRSSSLSPRAEVDPFFTTRAADFDMAAERARMAAYPAEADAPTEDQECAPSGP